MEKIESYKAIDGKIFLHEVECARYEQRLEYIKNIEKARNNIESKLIRIKTDSLTDTNRDTVKEAVPLDLVIPMYGMINHSSQFHKYIESKAVVFVKLDSAEDLRDLAMLEVMAFDCHCWLTSSNGVNAKSKSIVDDHVTYEKFVDDTNKWIRDNKYVTKFPCIVSCASGDRSVQMPEQLEYGNKVVTLESELKKLQSYLDDIKSDYIITK